MSRARATTGLVCATFAMAGCGGEGDFANEPRPPSPINVTASITDEKITVSPRSFGAGPVVMIIANQTDEAQRVTVETDQLAADNPGLKQSTAPINPNGTATLKVLMSEGRYTVSVEGAGIDGTSLRVGEQRPSSQDQLLLP